MKSVNIHEAKTQLSRLLVRTARGETIIIAKAGKPIAKLVPMASEPEMRPLGLDRNVVTVAEDFDAPLPAELQEAFES